MTEKDFNSGPGPQEQGEPLSATGMFLRAFDSGGTPSQEPEGNPFGAPTTSGPSASSVPSPAPASSQPGEFTQMFQAMDARSTPAASTPVAPPAFSAPVAPKPEPASPAPGEFTRIFVSTSAPPKEQPAREQVKPIAEAAPIVPPPAGPSKLKGFSTPGISDSASAEGSFTQFFKATPTAPPPAPPSVQAYTPPPVAPFQPPSAKEWPREPDFGASTKPQFDSGPTPASGSATGLLSSLSSPGAAVPSRTPEPAAYRPDPIPSYTPAPPPPETSAADTGGVTKLIQRLSQVQKEAPPEPVYQAPPPPAPQPSASSGPGEFTRMISGAAAKAAVSGMPPPAAAAPPLPPMPAVAMPAITMPAFHAPAAAPAAAPKFEAPKFEPPKVEAPKLAPLALAAPKGKLEAMVPILLVVNTFLLIVILLVVVFAMKGK
jgi:hypothetical protein